MNDHPAEYDYFYAALNSFAEKSGQGFQVSLSISTKIAEPTISNIMNKKRFPNFGQQIKIAKAFKYDYLSFIVFGKKLLQDEIPEAPSPVSAPYPLPADLHADVADVMSDVSAIMYSGEKGIIDALKKNVQEFKRAVATATRLNVCEVELKEVKEEIAELRKQFDHLTAPPTSVEGSDAS